MLVGSFSSIAVNRSKGVDMAQTIALTLNGIKAEGPGGSIEVLSWSWGLAQPATVSGPPGPDYQVFTFSSEIGVHSPQLIGSMVNHKTLSGGSFTVSTVKDEKKEGVSFAFNGEVLVESYEVGGNTAAPLQEEFTLNFTKLTMSSGGDKVSLTNSQFNNT
jgi:type VI protein secretion system component Hcp